MVMHSSMLSCYGQCFSSTMLHFTLQCSAKHTNVCQSMILQTISVQLLTDTTVVAMLRHKHDSTHPFSSGQLNSGFQRCEVREQRPKVQPYKEALVMFSPNKNEGFVPSMKIHEGIQANRRPISELGSVQCFSSQELDFAQF